jgi:dCMP deaminase
MTQLNTRRVISRPGRDEYFLIMAMHVSSRASCRRRNVGCVLVDKHHHVIATGYNGTPSGAPNCIERACPGATYGHGEGLDRCEAIHAEANALLQCKDVNAIYTAYCTDTPCLHCIKLLLNTGCERLVCLREYKSVVDEVRKRWVSSGRSLALARELFPPSERFSQLVDIYEFN